MWWGHPITTGSLQIDYFLGLDYEIKTAGGVVGDQSSSGNHYSEQLVRMDYMSSATFVPVRIAVNAVLFPIMLWAIDLVTVLCCAILMCRLQNAITEKIISLNCLNLS